MREVIKKERVQLLESSDARPARRAPNGAIHSHGGAALPAARLVDLESGAHAIEFTCACGEVSLLEIELDRAGSTRSSP